MSVRFAPSPTGTFHIGNLRTALVAFEWSRLLGVPFWVRFEDIDVPRVMPGAQEQQLSDLSLLGLTPDHIEVQSKNLEVHESLFRRALADGLVYPCFCSRTEVRSALETAASAPNSVPSSAINSGHMILSELQPVYDGSCRNLPQAEREKRLREHRMPTLGYRLNNKIASGQQDIIVGRIVNEQFQPAYHWACAIDDANQSHSLLVRAWDLESATFYQRAIQELILSKSNFTAVFHTSLILNNDGTRLEKRTRGVTLNEILALPRRTEEIIDKLQRSFKLDKTELSPARVWGERHKTLKVSEVI